MPSIEISVKTPSWCAHAQYIDFSPRIGGGGVGGGRKGHVKPACQTKPCYVGQTVPERAGYCFCENCFCFLRRGDWVVRLVNFNPLFIFSLIYGRQMFSSLPASFVFFVAADTCCTPPLFHIHMFTRISYMYLRRVSSFFSRGNNLDDHLS